MAFRESDGEFLWQQTHAKLESGRANDWPFQGVASSPLVEGDRLYYVSNRGVVFCLDIQGFRDNENDGAVKDEKLTGQFDADVIWSFDMMEEVGSYPHNLSNSSPVIWGDLLFVSTSNGQDESHVNIPSPRAPSIIALNKDTGKLVWEDNSVEDRILHGQWSTPSVGTIGGVRAGRLGAGRRLGARLRGRDRQEALGVRHQPEGLGLAAHAQRADRDAGDLSRIASTSPTARIPSTAKASATSTRSTRPSAATSRRRGRVWHFDKIRRSISTAADRRRAASTSPTSAASSTASTRRPASCTGRTTCSPPSGDRRSSSTARSTSATRTATSSSCSTARRRRCWPR